MLLNKGKLSCLPGNQENIQNLTKNIDKLLLQGYHPSPLLHSYEEIKTNWLHSPSDYYIIADNHGHIRHVYCHMEIICGSRGWMRIAYLNISHSTKECPPGFRLYQSESVRACGRQSSSSGSCQSVKFPSHCNYSQVCGRVVGYQYATPDAIDTVHGTGHNDTNSHYVDGVSITHGSPCKHIWTFMYRLMASTLYLDGGKGNRPCSQGSNYNFDLQSFIGNSHFCESGNQDLNWQSRGTNST